MNNKHFIQHITPAMLRDTPDQVSMILNEVIDRINEMSRE